MKDEYDFSDAEQGKFYRPLEELDIPIYLDPEIKQYFLKKMESSDGDFSLNRTINSLIRQDIEISRQLVL